MAELPEREAGPGQTGPLPPIPREFSPPDAVELEPTWWDCGCLINDGGAHRVGCPDYPHGRRGDLR